MPAAATAAAPPPEVGTSSQPETGSQAQPLQWNEEEAARDPFAPVRGLIKACVELWQLVWEAGSHLCADEGMISWEGASEGHISYIPRKPHPLGF